MSMLRLPSADVPEMEKRRFTEAEVHSKLFEKDMAALGFPPRTNTQADGEHFSEQRMLAARRLRSGKQRGYYDGLYLIGNSPVVLCELKAYEAIDSHAEFGRAVKQLQGYARSEDFAEPPPFLLLYCGKPERTRFYRRRLLADASLAATAHIGYIEKLPYRRPPQQLEAGVVERVETVVERLKADPEAEISSERAAIDELIFDLFEIRSSRAQVLDFYDTVGRAERSGEDVEALEAQAANE